MTTHEPLHYETTVPNAYKWTDKAFNDLVAGKLTVTFDNAMDVRIVSVGGPCPRCDDDVAFTQVLEAVGGESLATLGTKLHDAARPQFVSIVVSCRCVGDHPGRPPDVANGCGINFVVEARQP